MHRVESEGAASAAGLVDRRARLLEDGAGRSERVLADVTAQLRELLDAADPVVRPVDPDGDADLVGRLAGAEPVHPVRDARDLADRLDADRRLFVLEHPVLPGRPMNVVWVALWQGAPGSIDDVLDPDAPVSDPGTADTATFYSIWNADPGLAGLGRGESLIEGAVDLLRAELPQLSTFVTLSPMPGFRAWVEAGQAGNVDVGDQESLLRAAATYVTSLGGNGRPLDAVARFHVGNGARVWRVNADADRSARGAARSFGVMVNYRYGPEDRTANRAQLASGSVPVSPGVTALLE